MIATESYFEKSANEDTILAKVEAALKGDSQYIYGNGTGKEKLADNQFFSSKLINVNDDDMKRPIGQFEITSGKNEKGKNLKKALAYYYIDNVEIEYVGEFSGNSTILMGSPMQGGNYGMHVKGHANFKNSYTINNKGKGVLFEEDCGTEEKPKPCEGSVFFNGGVGIEESQIEFKTPTFFNSNVVLKDYENGTVFYDKVGFNKNIYVQGKNKTALGVQNDMWLGEGFSGMSYGQIITGNESPYYSNPNNYNTNDPAEGIKFNGSGTSNLYYDIEKLPVNSPNYVGNVPDWARLKVNDDGSPILSNVFSGFNNLENIHSENITTDGILNGMGWNTIVTAVAEGEFESYYDARTKDEPTLNMNNIGEGKAFVNLSDIIDGEGIVTLDALNRWCDGNHENISSENFYNGHLLINVNTTQVSFGYTTAGAIGTTPFPTPPGQDMVFNKKVIFKLDNSTASSGYFNSGSNASTLFYAGQNGKFNGFGTEGAFRGLIYIDDENLQEHVFDWGANSSIDGAVLLKGGTRVNWNAENASRPGTATLITRNQDLLNPFAGLTNGGVSSDKVAKQTGHIKLKPLGYYFY